MEYRTIEGVEIATVGMEWSASTGAVTISFEHLADAVTAANDDPHIIVPRVKLGHLSEVNGAPTIDTQPFVALGEAEPAFGRFTNLRLTNEGAVLVGDWIEAPDWLADAAPSAYPGRSMEAAFNVTTEGGKHYSMVVTAVALLGPIEPAIKDLDDLERVLLGGPTNVTTAASRPEEEPKPMAGVAASVDANAIRQRFNWEWTEDNDTEFDTYWWWCRSVRVDPLEIVADDDEGGLYLIPVTTDGKDEITFGEPVEVREDFVPVAASATSVVANFNARKGQTVLAAEMDRPEKPDKKTAASTQPDNEENEMSIDLDKLRSNLGLSEDATEEQINEALAKATAEPETPVTPSDDIPTEPEAGAETPAEPVAASSSERGVTVDKDALAQLQSDAAAGREARNAQLKSDRSTFLSQAVKDGKFPPSAKAAYAAQLSQGGEVEKSTREFIDGLAKNTVPVTETGEAGGDEAVAASAGLPSAWFPELATNGANGAKED